MNWEFKIALICIIQVLIRCVHGFGNCKDNQEKCDPPNCFCGEYTVPGGLNTSDIPQFILYSFDDAVTTEIGDMYDNLFPPGRLNPDGCPITMTMFISHNFTDYNVVRQLYKRGMEAAVHSVTHQVPTTYWKMASWDTIWYEIVEQRNLISQKAGIPQSNIRGWRSPFLQPSGDQQFNILMRQGFEYDSTLTVTTVGGKSRRVWPGTLNNGWNLPCNVNPCPFGKYDDLWEIPIQMLEYDNSTGCLYVDSCRPTDVTQAYKIFWANFLTHYTTTRSPIFYTMHPSWLMTDYNFKAMDQFMLTLLHYYKDVFFVTYQQLLEWIRNPIPIKEMRKQSPWKCEWGLNQGGRAVDSIDGSGAAAIGGNYQHMLVVAVIIFVQVLIYFA